MSPRTSTSCSTSSPSAPYPRRSAGQPKSSRQQFSACGACRMRRVRCDLKDLAFDLTGHHPACSNCKERGLKCVDEFADVKSVKLLRRGRRLQQVEAIYGKTKDHVNNASSSSSIPASQSTIPQLHPDFFNSPFWRQFRIQRPVLDPTEFQARFLSHVEGQQSLNPEARIITMLLVVWAFSFGVDERGVEYHESDHSQTMDGSTCSSKTKRSERVRHHSQATEEDTSMERVEPDRTEKTHAMVREILELIDRHAIMRRPTWDGVRVLLLIMPLMEDVQAPLDRITMYQSTLSQINALVSLASLPSSPAHPRGPDALAQARTFWYAYVQEGLNIGLRGGRFTFEEEDLKAFQKTVFANDVRAVPTSGLPSPDSPSVRLPLPIAHQIPLSQLPHAHQHIQNHHTTTLSPSQSHQPGPSFFRLNNIFTVPLHLSAICRRIHSLLTGPKAKRHAEEGGAIDLEGLKDVWEGLRRCWEEFDSMRRVGMGGGEEWEIERFASGWQIFIFECHNIIREALKQHAVSNSPPGGHDSPPVTHSVLHSSAPSPSSSTSSYLDNAMSKRHLHASATRKCLRLLPHILNIIKVHLGGDREEQSSPLFKWDAGFVRDGCFFAAFLAAGGESASDNTETLKGNKEGVELCLRALSTMDWVFSKCEEREQTIRMIWDNKRIYQPMPSQADASLTVQQQRHLEQLHNSYREHQAAFVTSVSLNVPPLIIPPLVHSAASTINTSRSEGGGHSWTVYTPPGTGTSSSETGISGGSPVYTDMPVQGVGVHRFKSEDAFYHTTGVELDQFNFSAPGLAASAGQEANDGYRHRAYQHHAYSLHPGGVGVGVGNAGYLDSAAAAAEFHRGDGGMSNGASDDGCVQFADECRFFS